MAGLLQFEVLLLIRLLLLLDGLSIAKVFRNRWFNRA